MTVSLVPRADGIDMEALRILAGDGSMSISAMAESLGAGRSQVVSAVQRLKASGRIVRVGGKRGR